MKNEILEATNPEDAQLPPQRGGWLLPVAGLAALFSLPYYFSYNTYFSHDDFAILWFHKDWPVSRPWVFFQTDVLTFYRPLQNYLLAVLFYWFHLNPIPYGVLLILIHLGNVVLFGRLVERLFGNRLLTALAVILFAASWVYWEVVCWKGNYGTALSWLFAMGACNVFADYLQRGGKMRYAGALGLTVLALLSKETAVNVPLLLTLVAWAARAAKREQFKRFDASEASDGSDLSDLLPKNKAVLHWGIRLFPFYALAGAYALFHVVFVRDVYTWIPKGYELQGPVETIAATIRAMNFWLTSSLRAAAQNLMSDRALGLMLLWFARRPLVYAIVPVLVAVIAVAGRNRRLGFGLLWAALAFFPASMTADYATGRYYYGAMMGAALVLAELALAADRVLARQQSFPALMAARVAGGLVILFLVHANMFLTTSIVTRDAQKCRQIADVQEFLASQQTVPPKTLFLVRCLNRLDHFHEGMGLREMFKLALRDDTIEAILPDQRLSSETLAVLLRDYPKPVEVLRDRTGRLTFRVPVPKPAPKTPASEGK
ncbi:MAG: hypothetical protein N3D11_01820 [Candidatus Sumerlaeia bacterium]|nr:hypothetical protein [Candidatus Sumerlaeia bacterium]